MCSLPSALAGRITDDVLPLRRLALLHLLVRLRVHSDPSARRRPAPPDLHAARNEGRMARLQLVMTVQWQVVSVCVLAAWLQAGCNLVVRLNGSASRDYTLLCAISFIL